MLLIINEKVVRDDENIIIDGVKELDKRLSEHKVDEIVITYALTKNYYEIYICSNDKKIKIGYFSNKVKESLKLKSYLKEHKFKCRWIV